MSAGLHLQLAPSFTCLRNRRTKTEKGEVAEKVRALNEGRTVFSPSEDLCNDLVLGNSQPHTLPQVLLLVFAFRSYHHLHPRKPERMSASLWYAYNLVPPGTQPSQPSLAQQLYDYVLTNHMNVPWVHHCIDGQSTATQAAYRAMLDNVRYIQTSKCRPN